MKKYISVITAILLICTTVSAQTGNKHEFSVWGAGGLSTLRYKTEVGDKKPRMGGAFGIGYNYRITDNYSIHSGMELSFYNAKTTIDNFSDRYMTRYDNEDFEFRTTVRDYTEKQNAMLLNIPVMFQYETHVCPEHKFYAMAGVKIGIPLNSKYKTADATYRNSGYFSFDDVVMETQEFAGFGTFSNKDMKESLDLKVAVMAALEAGMKWQLHHNWALYTGVYFECGLNDINKSDGTDLFVAYNRQNPSDFKNNSILTSQHSVGNDTERIAKKIVPIAVGLKVRLAFTGL